MLMMVETGFVQAAENGRGIYFDIGIGLGFVDYSSEYDDAFALMENAGFDRTVVSVDVCIGKAVTDKTYVVGSCSAFGDWLERDSDYFQLYTLLYGIGVKHYPLPSGTRFQIGGDVGFSRTVFMSNMPDMPSLASPLGFGFKLSAAYDFDATLTGPACLIGIESFMAVIQDETTGGFALFVKFMLK
jgi:hypothetical protein